LINAVESGSRVTMTLYVVVKSAALEPCINQDLPIIVDEVLGNALRLSDALSVYAETIYQQLGGSSPSFNSCFLAQASKSLAIFNDHHGAQIVKALVDLTKDEVAWLYEVLRH
jgi:hypothetical protein